MTAEDVIDTVRHLAADIDPAVEVYPDRDVVKACRRAQRWYSAQALTGFEVVTIDPDYIVVDEAFSDEVADDVGMILAYHAAVLLLQELYTGRLTRGELGVSWTSGLDAESSVTAAAHYRSLIDGVQSRLASLVTVYQRATTLGARIQ